MDDQLLPPELNENQQTNPLSLHPPVKNHHRYLYGAVMLSFMTLTLLIGIILYNQNLNSVDSQAGYRVQMKGNTAVVITTTPAPTVAPVPTIAGKKDINAMVQDLDATDPSSLGTDLNQNDTDMAQFSQ